jgi:hypothetical protein
VPHVAPSVRWPGVGVGGFVDGAQAVAVLAVGRGAESAASGIICRILLVDVESSK